MLLRKRRRRRRTPFTSGQSGGVGRNEGQGGRGRSGSFKRPHQRPSLWQLVFFFPLMRRHEPLHPHAATPPANLPQTPGRGLRSVRGHGGTGGHRDSGETSADWAFACRNRVRTRQGSCKPRLPYERYRRGSRIGPRIDGLRIPDQAFLGCVRPSPALLYRVRVIQRGDVVVRVPSDALTSVAL